MIKIEKVVVSSPDQWEAIIRGARNPLNSWHLSDTNIETDNLILGEKDTNLLQKLANAGTSHAKYRRMINVYLDITAPLYWWKEYDTNKVGTVANSTSTMHRIHAKEFTLEDFSHEHLDGQYVCAKAEKDGFSSWDILYLTIKGLNWHREKFLETNDKKYWWQMIQLLPSTYNQKRTVMLNYEVLANIYKDRKNHKLDEWQDFCKWIETLPYAEFIIGDKK